MTSLGQPIQMPYNFLALVPNFAPPLLHVGLILPFANLFPFSLPPRVQPLLIACQQSNSSNIQSDAYLPPDAMTRE